jgi:hypothetical protein
MTEKYAETGKRWKRRRGKSVAALCIVRSAATASYKEVVEGQSEKGIAWPRAFAALVGYLRWTWLLFPTGEARPDYALESRGRLMSL